MSRETQTQVPYKTLNLLRKLVNPYINTKEKLEKIAKEIFQNEFGTEPEELAVSASLYGYTISARRIISLEELPEDVAEYIKLMEKNAVELKLELAYPYGYEVDEHDWKPSAVENPVTWYKNKKVYVEDKVGIVQLYVDLVKLEETLEETTDTEEEAE